MNPLSCGFSVRPPQIRCVGVRHRLGQSESLPMRIWNCDQEHLVSNVRRQPLFFLCLNVRESYSDSRMQVTHGNRDREHGNIIHPKLLMREAFISKFQSAYEDWLHSSHWIQKMLLELGSNFDFLFFSLSEIGLFSFTITNISLLVHFQKSQKQKNWASEIVLKMCSHII